MNLTEHDLDLYGWQMPRKCHDIPATKRGYCMQTKFDPVADTNMQNVNGRRGGVGVWRRIVAMVRRELFLINRKPIIAHLLIYGWGNEFNLSTYFFGHL